MKYTQKGQALMTLLIFTVIAIIITSAAITVLMTNLLSGSKNQEGSIAYEIAESGIENGIIRAMRDPAYVGETLPVGEGDAVISVTGTGTKTITSVGTIGDFTRTIRVQLVYTNGSYSVGSWQEI